jgi:chorismate mutase
LGKNFAAAMTDKPAPSLPAPSLDAVRKRIDAIDADLLRLVVERASLAKEVIVAKAAAGDSGKFGLRPGRETALLKKLLAGPRNGARPGLIVRIWRELIGDSLATQGPFHIAVWGGRDPGRAVEVARLRFGIAPSLRQVAKPEDAIAEARSLGGVGVCALTPDSAWWGRLLAEPKLKVFAALPCLAAWGPLSALAVAEVEVEPTGADNTFWVTDAAQAAKAIEDALSRDGVAATLLVEAGGLKLFLLAGYYQSDDPRLARAPGKLSGVIGAAPGPLDV